MAIRSSDLILILLTFLFPPVGVAILAGFGADLLINLCLTFLGYFPGYIHAFWLIYLKFKAEEQRAIAAKKAGPFYARYVLGPKSSKGSATNVTSPLVPAVVEGGNVHEKQT